MLTLWLCISTGETWHTEWKRGGGGPAGSRGCWTNEWSCWENQVNQDNWSWPVSTRFICGQGAWVGACPDQACTCGDGVQESGPNASIHGHSGAGSPLVTQFWLFPQTKAGFQGEFQWASVQYLVVQDPQFHQGSGRWEFFNGRIILVWWTSFNPLAQDPKEAQRKRQRAWKSPAQNKQLAAMENNHNLTDSATASALQKTFPRKSLTY